MPELYLSFLCLSLSLSLLYLSCPTVRRCSIFALTEAAKRPRVCLASTPLPPLSPVFAACGLHPGVACERSGLCPIVGDRFVLDGQPDFSLCASEFEALPLPERALYSRIRPPVRWRPPRKGGRGRGGDLIEIVCTPTDHTPARQSVEAAGALADVPAAPGTDAVSVRVQLAVSLPATGAAATAPQIQKGLAPHASAGTVLSGKPKMRAYDELRQTLALALDGAKQARAQARLAQEDARRARHEASEAREAARTEHLRSSRALLRHVCASCGANMDLTRLSFSNSMSL